jgi:uncharacterized protein YjbI with pentapeptide repeats
MFTMLGGILLILFVVLGYTILEPYTGFREKKLWDWYVIGVPAFALAVVGWTTAQRAQQRRRNTDLRSHEDALKAYLDEMSTLLLDKDLRTSKEDDEVRTVARARTLMLLSLLAYGRLQPEGLRSDATRKRHIIRFLYEATLIQGSQPIISLEAADLSYADLRGLELSDVNLSGANLSDADLSKAYLGGADLSYAVMSEANLQGANLQNANVTKALGN